MAVLTTIMNSSSIDGAQQASSSVSALQLIDTIDELVVESEKNKKKNQDHDDIDTIQHLPSTRKWSSSIKHNFLTFRQWHRKNEWNDGSNTIVEDDERDDSIASSTSSSRSDSTGRSSAYSSDSFQKTARLGPFLLLDVRSKAKRAVSMIHSRCRAWVWMITRKEDGGTNTCITVIPKKTKQMMQHRSLPLCCIVRSEIGVEEKLNDRWMIESRHWGLTVDHPLTTFNSLMVSYPLLSWRRHPVTVAHPRRRQWWCHDTTDSFLW